MKIEVSGGSYRYPRRDRNVLDAVSFELETGDVLAILGPNGAGKTTLLRCMTGLLPWDAGTTLLDGKRLREIPQKRLWQRMSYVPQAKQAPAAYTAEEMILLGRTASLGVFSLPGKEDMETVDGVIEKLRLTDIRRRRCAELSGGEFQMVLIARALASGPEALILDEPESNLDFQNQLLVLDLISQLSAEGITCIFNTHYPAHALRRGTKALMLARDGAYRFGNVREVVTEENILRCFGVRSVIGELETTDHAYPDVIPIAAGGYAPTEQTEGGPVIAGITVLTEGTENAEAINRLLHEYGDCLIGRMGLPYRRAGVNIINLTLEAPVSRVLSLADGLARLAGTHVKTTYIAGRYEDGSQSIAR